MEAVRIQLRRLEGDQIVDLPDWFHVDGDVVLVSRDGDKLIIARPPIASAEASDVDSPTSFA